MADEAEVVFMTVFGGCIGFCFGWCIGNAGEWNKWRSEMIKQDLAHYDSKTAKWIWDGKKPLSWDDNV